MHGRNTRAAALNAFTACGSLGSTLKNVQFKAPADLAMLEITPKTKFQPKSRQHRPIMCIQGPIRVSAV
jgi:hypothetical protein